jgi:hypothetical protein
MPSNPPSSITPQTHSAAHPFLEVAGNYNGLFHAGDQTNGLHNETSGAVSLALTKRGRYSGHLILAGRRLAVSGRFDLDGRATNTVKRAGSNALEVELGLDLGSGSDQLFGRVIDPENQWSADLHGDRAPVYTGTNPSPYQGHYTLLFTHRDLATSLGASFGTVQVSRRGRITWSGRLADHTPVTQSVPLSKDGQWPLYVGLYGGKGSLLSWVTFHTNPAPSMSGVVSWIKPTLTPTVIPQDSSNPSGVVRLQPAP